MPTTFAYTEEFRRQAVDLMTTEKLSVAEAARRLGLDANPLRKWLKKNRPPRLPPRRRPSSNRNYGDSARRTAN